MLLAAACTSPATPIETVVGATPTASAPARPTAPAPSPPPRRRPLALTVATGGPPGSLIGIGAARTVVEYPVSGDRTGLLVLLDTHTDVIGPLRSATPSDAALALAFDAELVTARTTGTVVDQVRRGDLAVVEEHVVAGALVRDPARRAPFNLYAFPEAIREAVGRTAEPTGDALALPWASSGGPAGRPAGEVMVRVADDAIVTWTWDPGGARWLRTVDGHLEQTATGERVTASTVVVLEVPPVADRPAVVADLTGAGAAMVLRDGAVSDARWERSEDAQPPTVIGAGNVPAATTTWVHVCATPCR